jgi:N6-L-threonylcarbamoyladenine synthase
MLGSRPVLGIETSCDETAAAVLAPDGTILSELLLSQDEHAQFQGVVPEVAARAHLAHLPGLVRQALGQAGLAAAELGAVAATVGPGLIGGLLVGSGFAKGLSLAAGVPFVAVNHLAAHALVARLPTLEREPPGFPYLLLLVSGGHTLLARVEAVDRFTLLGETIDDAAGECFDKTARALGLGWPGGPALERLAAAGDARVERLPRPMLGRPGCDFSFSGLKTAVAGLAARGLHRVEDLAAATQVAIAAVLADRATNAMAANPDCTVLVAAGGVAANQAVRAALAAAAAKAGCTLVAPPIRLCTDNAVMVAWAAIERLGAGLPADRLDAAENPRLTLERPVAAG